MKRFTSSHFLFSFLFIIVFMPGAIYGQQNIMGFDHYVNIGNPKIQGSSTYNAGDQTYTLSGAGKNIWGTADAFYFLCKQIKGDFIISATVHFIGQGIEPHRKIGIMARNDLTAGSVYADACVHGDGLSALQYRQVADDTTAELTVSSFSPVNIALERDGNMFTFSAATPGENYKSVSRELNLQNEVYAGIFICSHNETVLEKAIFSNVRIIIPAEKNFVPYHDYIGSHIEIMDVQSGLRKIIHSAPNSLQAPNWTKDGQHLIYNADGLMYTYNLQTSLVTPLPTGTAIHNNNDHVLSFDGKWLAISNHVGAQSVSTIFTLPVSGSNSLQQITSIDSGHSYLHGWSPDGRNLVFTGQRKGIFNIYKIDLQTKKEIQLTHTSTLDDGPEYTPDGKWIYFNSVRTGTMQIWRMLADGSLQEQITFDEYNNWFPHISPDGKWIVYIAFPKDINPADHPFYKKVYIKLMPTSVGAPKTIAYVYGGQGTMNVPSWSPDSQRIAFVSNTQFP